MIAEPPVDSGTVQVRRIWPDRFVGAAANVRGAVGAVRGMLLTMLLTGLDPALVGGVDPEVVTGAVGEAGHRECGSVLVPSGTSVQSDVPVRDRWMM